MYGGLQRQQLLCVAFHREDSPRGLEIPASSLTVDGQCLTVLHCLRSVAI